MLTNIQQKTNKNSKLNRFNNLTEEDINLKNKKSWPTDAVVYIGHLPHGFYQDQLKNYFSQYGEVLGVKVARSKKTARSRGYAFIQFKYSQIAQIVSQTMNNYLLMGKVLKSHALSPTHKNPFHFPSSKKYKFINWKKLFINFKNKEKNQQEIKKQIQNLLEKQQQKRNRLKQLGINYEFPGFKALL